MKLVVNCLSKKEYGEILNIVNSSVFTADDITELVDGFLEVNEQKGIDAFGENAPLARTMNIGKFSFIFTTIKLDLLLTII